MNYFILMIFSLPVLAGCIPDEVYYPSRAEVYQSAHYHEHTHVAPRHYPHYNKGRVYEYGQRQRNSSTVIVTSRASGNRAPRKLHTHNDQTRTRYRQKGSAQKIETHPSEH